MAPTRTGSCCCGQLNVHCSGEPALVSLCHCKACQRRTGSTYGIAVFFDADRVSIEGDCATYIREGASGQKVRFQFCPNCGSTVFWEPEKKPGIVAVAYGAFADPDLPVPDQETFTENRAHWVRALD